MEGEGASGAWHVPLLSQATLDESPSLPAGTSFQDPDGEPLQDLESEDRFWLSDDIEELLNESSNKGLFRFVPAPADWAHIESVEFSSFLKWVLISSQPSCTLGLSYIAQPAVVVACLLVVAPLQTLAGFLLGWILARVFFESIGHLAAGMDYKIIEEMSEGSTHSTWKALAKSTWVIAWVYTAMACVFWILRGRLEPLIASVSNPLIAAEAIQTMTGLLPAFLASVFIESLFRFLSYHRPGKRVLDLAKIVLLVEISALACLILIYGVTSCFWICIALSVGSWAICSTVALHVGMHKYEYGWQSGVRIVLVQRFKHTKKQRKHRKPGRKIRVRRSTDEMEEEGTTALALSENEAPKSRGAAGAADADTEVKQQDEKTSTMRLLRRVPTARYPFDETPEASDSLEYRKEFSTSRKNGHERVDSLHPRLAEYYAALEFEKKLEELEKEHDSWFEPKEPIYTASAKRYRPESNCFVGADALDERPTHTRTTRATTTPNKHSSKVAVAQPLRMNTAPAEPPGGSRIGSQLSLPDGAAAETARRETSVGGQSPSTDWPATKKAVSHINSLPVLPSTSSSSATVVLSTQQTTSTTLQNTSTSSSMSIPESQEISQSLAPPPGESFESPKEGSPDSAPLTSNEAGTPPRRSALRSSAGTRLSKGRSIHYDDDPTWTAFSDNAKEGETDVEVPEEGGPTDASGSQSRGTVARRDREPLTRSPRSPKRLDRQKTIVSKQTLAPDSFVRMFLLDNLLIPRNYDGYESWRQQTAEQLAEIISYSKHSVACSLVITEEWLGFVIFPLLALKLGLVAFLGVALCQVVVDLAHIPAMAFSSAVANYVTCARVLQNDRLTQQFIQYSSSFLAIWILVLSLLVAVLRMMDFIFEDSTNTSLGAFCKLSIAFIEPTMLLIAVDASASLIGWTQRGLGGTRSCFKVSAVCNWLFVPLLSILLAYGCNLGTRGLLLGEAAAVFLKGLGQGFCVYLMLTRSERSLDYLARVCQRAGNSASIRFVPYKRGPPEAVSTLVETSFLASAVSMSSCASGLRRFSTASDNGRANGNDGEV